VDGVVHVELHKSDTPICGDWVKLYGHIKKTGDFDLLHKRISATAIKERWMGGKDVPGIEHMEAFDAVASIKRGKEKAKK
jgi:hypothetical protein